MLEKQPISRTSREPYYLHWYEFPGFVRAVNAINSTLSLIVVILLSA